MVVWWLHTGFSLLFHRILYFLFILLHFCVKLCVISCICSDSLFAIFIEKGSECDGKHPIVFIFCLLRHYTVAFCAAWNGGEVVVSYGWDQQLGAGWFAPGSQPPAEVCPLGLSACLGPGDLTWDYPGDLARDYPRVSVLCECLVLF